MPIASAPRSVDIGTIVATYDYHDESGALVYQVVRYAPKAFRQRRPDGTGGWIWSLDSKGSDGKPVRMRRVLYRLGQLTKADPDQLVWIVEGEKDVHAMESLGFVATCNPGGAGKWSMVADCAKKALKGRHVVVMSDGDDKGKDHAADVAKRLQGIAASVRVIDPVRGHDAASWIELGGTGEEFLGALPAVPVEQPKPATAGTAAIAAKYIAEHATHPDGYTLRRWQGQWYRWRDGCYHVTTDEEIDESLYCDFGLTEPKEVRECRSALISARGVLINSVKLGAWIGPSSAVDVVTCPNGILDLETRTLVPSSPRLFVTGTLGAAYDPTPPEPTEWYKFLSQLWPDDQESIDVLQEWFGYQLTPDTSQQKIMFICGLPRSGKGTIIRVMLAMMGDGNIVSSSPDSIGNEFGLQPLIGKICAVMPDARIGPKTNMEKLTSRLLSISGQDMLTINRKNIPMWTGHLSTRFTIASNPLLKFDDPSGAIIKRLVVLNCNRSFAGKEDHGLTDKLKLELPSILHWAINGWHRLRERGHFVQPQSSSELIDDMIDLASPVAAWMRERCDVAPGQQVDCGEAYKDFSEWRVKNGESGDFSRKRFGSDLRDTGSVRRVSARGVPSGSVYRGIGLISYR
jgi:P4 family phage/plasmid primase-like protien